MIFGWTMLAEWRVGGNTEKGETTAEVTEQRCAIDLRHSNREAKSSFFLTFFGKVYCWLHNHPHHVAKWIRWLLFGRERSVLQ